MEGKKRRRQNKRLANSTLNDKCSSGSITELGDENIPRRFQDACDQIEANSKRLVAQANLQVRENDSSDDSQDDQHSTDVMGKVLQAYQGEGDHSERTQQFLIDSLTSGATVCLICIETVKRVQAVWSCQGCFGIFHLLCIQKWAVDSVQIQRLALAEEEASLTTKRNLAWCCPKCRQEYQLSEKPDRYLCFCQKQRDPPNDPWLVPHSCGEICQKELQPLCSHKCLLLCHPGPCPPCAQTVRSSCYCGSQKPVPRRCSRKEWSCHQPCGKVLTCKQHKCQQPCHSGECEACPRQSTQLCLCGGEKQLRSCASPHWKCTKVCGKNLSCGHHSCAEVCHQGLCGPCPRQGRRKCPCGNTVVSLPCTEEVSTCGDTCDKVLECGLHRCTQRCHFGPCGNCLQVLMKRCRCEAKEKALPCYKEFLCESKCKRLRDCRRHPCSRKCCDGNCPLCEQICGKTLSCKNHKCNSQCHLGPCYPCPLVVAVTCNCGGTRVSVPCGRERATKPPRCKKACTVLPDCHHQKGENHRCHVGACPPCQQVCKRPLFGCSHTCPVNCHDAVMVKVKVQQKRAGPWEPVLADREEVRKLSCPPCLVPMPLKCLGMHTIQDFACSDLRPWSCSRKCGRALPCGNHFCSQECHSPKEVCGDCDWACTFPQPEGCRHTCAAIGCHPGPCPRCSRMEATPCHCGLVTLHLVCSEWTSADPQTKETIKCCLNRCPKQLSCGHRCPQTCHPGSCPAISFCKKRVALRCPCKRLKQEAPCNAKVAAPVCDSLCLQAQQKEEEARRAKELKQKEEEERHDQEEMDRYIRRTEGKRKKNRKTRSENQDLPVWSLTKKMVVVNFSVLVVAVAVTAYYLYL